MVNMVNECLSKKLKILYILYYSNLFKFHQLMAKKFIKELQIVLTSNVNNSNGNMEELQRKIWCKKSCSDRVFYVIVANADTGSLKYHL